MAATDNILQHCQAARCLPKLKGETRDDVIAELIDALVSSESVDTSDAARVLSAVMAREEEGTTGIGGGVAMPHARELKGLDETIIAVGLHESGVEWEATDGDPVHVVFLILCTDSEQYLNVARRIATVARDSVEMRALRRQSTPKAMLKFLQQSWA